MTRQRAYRRLLPSLSRWLRLCWWSRLSLSRWSRLCRRSRPCLSRWSRLSLSRWLRLCRPSPAPANQCNEVEIYDPAIAAQGVPGANGNTVDGQPLQGSGNGCVPVCVWFDRYGGEVVYSGQLNLNRALSINQGNPGGVWLFKTPTSVFNPYVYGYSIDINPSDSESQGAKFLPTIVEVKVDAGQQSCSGYDAQGNVVALTPYQARQQGLYG